MVVWLRPKCADVVTRMKQLADLPVRIIAGCTLADLQPKAIEPYAPEVVEFLTTFSKRLFARPDIRSYPDAASFAYWCRPANLAKLQRELGDDSLRLGRGLALHIAPANVPVNFAYSFAFGLLAGNANIVRVPESLPAQADVLCAIANELLLEAEFGHIAFMNTLISYSREDSITQQLSAVADVRLLWGGDQTILNLRRMPASPHCVDIAFSDRYSLCLMSASAILSADNQTLQSLSIGFYNDVFLLDQHACSSPHLVLWQGSARDVKAAQKRFWESMQILLVSKERLPGIHAVDKYTHLCRTAVQLEGVKVIPTPDNRVIRVVLDELPENIAEHRGRYGFFFESIDNDLAQLTRIVNARYQTLTYFGVDNQELAQMVLAKKLPGIDRIVPVGKALDIGVIWDGYDLIRTMSRIIDTQ